MNTVTLTDAEVETIRRALTELLHIDGKTIARNNNVYATANAKKHVAVASHLLVFTLNAVNV
jgi:hypothetical protein